MKIKNLLKSSVIVALIGTVLVLNSCKKEQIVKEENLNEGDISKVESKAVPFFELAKGDTLAKGVIREKPDFGNEEATILFDTETGNGLKGSGDALNSDNSPLVNLTVSSQNYSRVPDGYIPIDLNEGAGGNWIYLKCGFEVGSKSVNYLDVDITSSPKTFQLNSEPYAGYNQASQIPADCNDGAGGKYIYIKRCYDSSTEYVRQIRIVSGTSSGITQPEPWKKVAKDLNAGAGGKYIYIFYKKY